MRHRELGGSFVLRTAGRRGVVAGQRRPFQDGSGIAAGRRPSALKGARCALGKRRPFPAGTRFALGKRPSVLNGTSFAQGKSLPTDDSGAFPRARDVSETRFRGIRKAQEAPSGRIGSFCPSEEEISLPGRGLFRAKDVPFASGPLLRRANRTPWTNPARVPKIGLTRSAVPSGLAPSFGA